MALVALLDCDADLAARMRDLLADDGHAAVVGDGSDLKWLAAQAPDAVIVDAATVEGRRTLGWLRGFLVVAGVPVIATTVGDEPNNGVPVGSPIPLHKPLRVAEFDVALRAALGATRPRETAANWWRGSARRSA